MKLPIPFLLPFILIGALSSLLGGCGISTVSTGAQAVYDRYSLRNTLSDHYITLQAERAIYWHTKDFKDTHIDVTTFNQVVLLTGQVDTPALRERAGNIVKKIPGVSRVYNLIAIISPTSTLTRCSDAWITTKIKSQIIATDEIEPSRMKIVTENGTVYLMGIVFPNQARKAIEIARTTDGVQHVIVVFSYLHVNRTLAEK